MSLKTAKAHISEQGYIELEFLEEDTVLTLKDVSIGWELAKKIDSQKKHGVYLKTAKWSLLDKEARNFVITELKSWPIVAILVHNLGQKLMGNFAINLIGGSKNIRIFENETQAISWLLEKQKNHPKS